MPRHHACGITRATSRVTRGAWRNGLTPWIWIWYGFGYLDLVELADDRLRRATRQQDGEPGWRFKIPKPLLARFGKAAYNLVRGDVIFVVVSLIKSHKEELMDSKRTSRRDLLKTGAASAVGLTLGDIAARQAHAHDHPMTPGSENASPMVHGSKELIEYGQRSRYVTSVRIQHPPGG